MKTAPVDYVFQSLHHQNRRIENRIPGADANCYLAIAASLLCGYIGMVEQLKPSTPVQGKANESRSNNTIVCL